MKKLIAVLVVSISTFVATAADTTYLTEATITPRAPTRGADTNLCEVVVRVMKLVEQDGKVTEELVSEPKLLVGRGDNHSSFTGLCPPTHPNYQKEENVTVDVFCPKSGDTGFASCTVTVKRGDKVVSKSKLKVKVENK